ncbi:MFS transporter [Burkholderia sp. SRS-W-2-2016]|uniref:MFS transporter n=1 Tax=Burkholderia sp. SRS-W-2-2016 TaxID=1926878 RepID=UPI00094B64BA|nr:MFS transporter [Burkholderia sp. SRS-W-2-2016]OLL31816.1 MFS transporter [Burkholderia sp. SRS-W-2-2016]
MPKAFPHSASLSGAPAGALSRKQRGFLAKLTVLISGGMFIDGFILGSIGIVMPAITHDLQLSLAWQGLIGASALVGIFIGGPLGGWLADKVGRKPMFTVDLAIFLVGSIAQFFVTEAWQLFVVRILMGIAIGADYSIGWPLLAEFAPARLRGKLLAVLEVAWYVGYLISYAIGWALTESSSAGWHVILGLSTVPTVIVFLMRLGTPESPRWLMSKGRRDEAKALAAEHMSHDEQLDLHAQGVAGKQGFARLFSPEYIRNTIFVSVFWVCNVTPYFAIGAFAPVVLQKLGLKEGLTGGLALNGVAVLGTVLAVVLIERVGRRKLGIPPFFISALALMCVALFAHASPTIILVCFFTFSLVNAMSTTLCGVYPGEVFPTEIRGMGVGFATAFSRVGAAAGTFLLPVVIGSFGVSTAMLIAAGISLFGGIVSYALAPETRGKLLSEASAPHRKSESLVPSGELKSAR